MTTYPDDLAEKRGRRAVLDVLKREGPSRAQDIATWLGVSAMAVRQHLYRLQEEGLARHTAKPSGGVGRPAKLWRLSPAADAFFPDGHADLSLGLIEAMKATFGEAGLERLLAVRGAEQVASYRDRIAGASDLEQRLRRLAEQRTAEGYMAEVRATDDGAWLFIENHCPICAAARACTGLCASELTVFREALGDGICVERQEHILAGARRCAYRIAPQAV